MNEQAVVLKGLLYKDTWFSLQTVVTEDEITHPDARKVLKAMRRLHEEIEGDLSLTSVRLDIESTYKLDGTARDSLLATVDEMESAPQLHKNELDPVVRKFVSKNRLLHTSQYLAEHLDDDEPFDFDELITHVEGARDASISFDTGIQSFKTAGAPDEIKRTGTRPTGLSQSVDKLMEGGGGEGELIVYLAPGNRGKTTALTKTASVNARGGCNVLIVGMEIAANQYFGLIDKELTGMKKEDVLADPLLAMRKREELAGEIWVKDWSAGINGNKVKVGDIRNLLIGMRRQGQQVDVLIVDQWENMAPSKFHRQERFGYKEIGEHLRMLGNEFKIPVFTVWQCNRPGYKVHVIQAEHIGEDISVMKTTDFVLTLNQNEEERANRRMRVGFLKQRVGKNYPVVDCYWDIERMVFRDRTDQDIEDNLKVEGLKDAKESGDDKESQEEVAV